ncbi:uncharacterized protein LOC105845203 isoform X1 [Hydra vulgaris]|uniref:uncharacterized protein LOC105845203 isoform X1 n=1 Tax=Hydra vulgaris TaxID=6087 RepID=UPI00064157D1|nr:uncharacterized protein LOC105845203 [Hydra vulgaris]
MNLFILLAIVCSIAAAPKDDDLETSGEESTTTPYDNTDLSTEPSTTELIETEPVSKKCLDEYSKCKKTSTSILESLSCLFYLETCLNDKCSAGECFYDLNECYQNFTGFKTLLKCLYRWNECMKDDCVS